MPERLVIKDLNEALKRLEEGKAPQINQAHLTRYLYAKSLLQEGDCIMDIACGSGYGSKLLAEHGCKVLAIDISAEAIKLAKKFNNHKNITFIQGDIVDCKKYAKELLDGIVCFETLEHIESGQEEILNDFKSMLKKGKPAITSIPINHPDTVWHKRMFTFDQRDAIYKDIFEKYDYPKENGSLVIGWNV
jgi:2-polyprenyl-3-methyl-5-hydroxy-6-metoxy-1,4-benzoquinol methylase